MIESTARYSSKTSRQRRCLVSFQVKSRVMSAFQRVLSAHLSTRSRIEPSKEVHIIRGAVVVRIVSGTPSRWSKEFFSWILDSKRATLQCGRERIQQLVRKLRSCNVCCYRIFISLEHGLVGDHPSALSRMSSCERSSRHASSLWDRSTPIVILRNAKVC